MSRPLFYAFIACQCYVVLFIAVHDWIPLGKLNNLVGIREADSRGKLLVVTAVSALPFAIGLTGSIYYAGSRFPDWLLYVLWISYVAGVYGMLRAWWIPYLLVTEPERIARYQVRFAHTHAFLPLRNGIRPDTLHVSFHVVLLATLVLLGVMSFEHAAMSYSR
jgi:hypothetical protein